MTGTGSTPGLKAHLSFRQDTRHDGPVCAPDPHARRYLTLAVRPALWYCLQGGAKQYMQAGRSLDSELRPRIEFLLCIPGCVHVGL
jgi:hypothetical protein